MKQQQSRTQQFTQMIEELPVGSFLIFINAVDSIHSIMDVKRILEGKPLTQIGKIGQNLEITGDELNYIGAHLPKDCCAFSLKQYAKVILIEVSKK